MSGLLLQQDLWVGGRLPTLHVHPAAHRVFDLAQLPFEHVTYDVDGSNSTLSQAQINPAELLGLPAGWPGPEDPFEGINTDAALPQPTYWTPGDPMVDGEGTGGKRV